MKYGEYVWQVFSAVLIGVLIYYFTDGFNTSNKIVPSQEVNINQDNSSTIVNNKEVITINNFPEKNITAEKSKKSKFKETSKPNLKPSLTEVPFQLPRETKGYKSVFINGSEAKLSHTSTSFNPRIFINVNPQPQEILVITINNDTCKKSLIIDENFSNNVIGRITLNCTK